MASELLYEVQGAVGVVTFNRPAAHNALTFEMYDRLGEICATTPTDGSLRALIITGAGGRAFAAGTDIPLFRNFRSAADGLGYEERRGKGFNKLERCPLPTIAAIPDLHRRRSGDRRLRPADCHAQPFGFFHRPHARQHALRHQHRQGSRVDRCRARVDMAATTVARWAPRLVVGLVNELLDTPEALMSRAHLRAAQIATRRRYHARHHEIVGTPARAAASASTTRTRSGVAAAALTSRKA
jgi:enoyl-CoA hydratase/carnithine racemase